MSYQPQPPMMSVPAPPPPAPPPDVPRGDRRRGLLWIGVGVLVAGLVAGVVLYAMSSSATDDAVKQLARAPVGCTTTLEFERSGTFIIYVETKGSTGDVAGDCPTGGESYDRADSDLPEVDLTLHDGNDDEVSLDTLEGVSYDAAGFAGESVSSVQIDEPGTFRLTVESLENDFAISIGNDPNDAADSLTTMALIAVGVGVLAGGALILLGLRRRPTAAVPGPYSGGQPATVEWQPQATAWQPQAPPPADPFGHPPTAPLPPQPPGQSGWGTPPP